MRKQITFYIIWDVLFLALLLGYCEVSTWAQESYFKYTGPQSMYLIIFYPILLGAAFALLNYVSSRFHFTEKLALLELIIVGGLGLYLSTTLVLAPLLAPLFASSLPFFLKFWLYYGTTPNILGSILLGYVLFRFISRMAKREKEESDLEM
jgi:hypothetical protein